jgi:hypothetical protein
MTPDACASCRITIGASVGFQATYTTTRLNGHQHFNIGSNVKMHCREQGLGEGSMTKPTGAQFEITIDGKPRSYRDIKVVAIASAEFLKSRNPNSNVAVKDLQTGEVTPVAFRPQRA